MSKPENSTYITAKEFGALFEHYRPRFEVIARRYVRDPMVAEDLVADSFMAFWENREKSESIDNIPAYIFKMVVNRCLNWLETKARRNIIEQKIHSKEQRMIDAGIRSLKMCDPDQLFTDELIMIVRGSLEKMPRLTREVFISSRLLEKSYKEIAEEKGITTRRVDFEIQKSLKTLRIALKDFLISVLI